MKTSVLACLTIILGFAVAVAPAHADLLYTSGPYSGNGYLDITTNSVSDSFTVSENATATSVTFVIDGSAPATAVEWSLGTSIDGSDLGSGDATLTSFMFPYVPGNDTYSYAETFSLPDIAMTTGTTYYLTLTDLVDADSVGNVGWDINGNDSDTDSETFKIHGTDSTAAAATPEPSSLLLLATGLLGLGLPLAARVSRALPARA